MDEKNIREYIESELGKRKTKVVNKNAIDALFAALPSPVQSLRKIFIGRQDAIEIEKQKIAQDIILQLLINIDNAITQALEKGREKGVDWIIIDGKIQSYGENVKEVIGVNIASNSGPVELKPGTHIKASGKDACKITGLKIGED